MKQKPKLDKLDNFFPIDREAWREWLSKNHACSHGVWLTVRKKKSRQRGILLDEALDEAVSFGWIDSKLHVLDCDFYQLLFTPRKSGGTWALSNKGRVEKLIRQGKMTEAGMAKVNAAKSDGSWDRLTDIDELKLPDDFKSALAANVAAQEHYNKLGVSVKKQVLWWIATAKTTQTRAKRILTVIEKLQSSKRNPFT